MTIHWVVLAGYTGVGKSIAADEMSQITGWKVLDKDELTNGLAETTLLQELGSYPGDRVSEIYQEQVRPAEYAAFKGVAAGEIIAGAQGVILTAPFTHVLNDPDYWNQERMKLRIKGISLHVIWVTCPTDLLQEKVDSGEVAWDEFVSGAYEVKGRQYADYLISNDADAPRIGAQVQSILKQIRDQD